jgi:hypothetical protein
MENVSSVLPVVTNVRILQLARLVIPVSDLKLMELVSQLMLHQFVLLELG